jgi:hypothetical protein
MSSGQPVNPRNFVKHAKKYSDKLYQVLVEYREARRKATAASSSSAATKAADA